MPDAPEIQSNVPQLTRRKAKLLFDAISKEVLDRAIHYVIKFDARCHGATPPPPELWEEFDAWLKADARHAVAYLRVVNTKNRTHRRSSSGSGRTEPLSTEQVANAWIIEVYGVNNRDPQLPPREWAQFQAWLEADPRHKAALIESNRAWDALTSIPRQILQEVLDDGTPEDKV